MSRCAFQLSRVGLHLFEIEHRPERPVGEHNRIVRVLMLQMLKHAVRLRASDQSHVSPTRSTEIANNAVVIVASVIGHPYNPIHDQNGGLVATSVGITSDPGPGQRDPSRAGRRVRTGSGEVAVKGLPQ